VFKLTKTAMCIGIMAAVASVAAAGPAASKRHPNGMSSRDSRALSSFGQAQALQQGRCWVPTRDDTGEYGGDSRGLGYWGSCSEKGAVPFK
jgi:hypothetical protein